MGAIGDGVNSFDLKTLASLAKSNFKEGVISSLLKSLRGRSRLEGNGELVKLFPYLENQANKQGVIGVIFKGGKILPVSVANLKTEKGKTFYEYKFARNPYYQYSELKLEMPELVNGESTGRVIEETFYPDLVAAGNDRSKLFAILENDVDLCPDLVGIESDLTKLEVILDAVFHDIVVSKKKLYFIFPQDPDPEDWKKAGIMWEKGIMGYISLPKSAKPDAKSGKTGIDPNNIQLNLMQPESKGRDLWNDYRTWKQEILWKYGIRYDILEEKNDRASVSEVQQSTSYFDNIDNERKQCRINFIQWCIENWGNQAVNIDYKFTYGGKS